MFWNWSFELDFQVCYENDQVPISVGETLLNFNCFTIWIFHLSLFTTLSSLHHNFPLRPKIKAFSRPFCNSYHFLFSYFRPPLPNPNPTHPQPRNPFVRGGSPWGLDRRDFLNKVNGMRFFILKMRLLIMMMAWRPWKNADSTVGKESPSQREATPHLLHDEKECPHNQPPD